MDKRLSFSDAELGLPPERLERPSAVKAWIARHQEGDPTPREEVARVFFTDAIHAATRIH